ncbi:probable protein phosphatase 2C 39 isoform X2 [Ananas comosus]|uniref:protein-serine/threonine phosphatase n=1 Tax=Ananas comosus TaxID=4615 RepID=A0A6P5GL59_ANACO|nr:probable protein phosphatase 2C 39 isoform X2 [Ananas comosus]
MIRLPSFPSDTMEEFEEHAEINSDLKVSFGYHCNSSRSCFAEANYECELSSGLQIQDSKIKSRSSSFSCLSGAAISANFTLANTNICNGLIGEEILPELDSPNSFRKMTLSPSVSRLDLLSSSQGSVSTDNENGEVGKHFWQSMSAPTRVESSSFLKGMDVQMAGGAAGEDRVQAVCSEENGLLFCGVYDGFNGRDAADYLAGTLYDNIGYYLYLLEWRIKQQNELSGSHEENHFPCSDGLVKSNLSLAIKRSETEDTQKMPLNTIDVLDCLTQALAQAESDFMRMVEQEMEDRPDLVSVGSCVLIALLHGMDLHILNLGDSRAVLATCNASGSGLLRAIQLTETHNVDNELEHKKLLADHPDDTAVVLGGKIKGKLKVTRAFGVGYLKEKKFNDALMGILRVRNLRSPPYVYTNPHTLSHRVSESDLFVVLGSDGLFDFFSNDEVVKLAHEFIQGNPCGDPAKYLIEQLLLRAAKNAGLSAEELTRIPVGRRRKYHDDVTVIVIILGNKQRTSRASTSY